MNLTTDEETRPSLVRAAPILRCGYNVLWLVGAVLNEGNPSQHSTTNAAMPWDQAAGIYYRSGSC